MDLASPALVQISTSCSVVLWPAARASRISERSVMESLSKKTVEDPEYPDRAIDDREGEHAPHAGAGGGARAPQRGDPEGLGRQADDEAPAVQRSCGRDH